MIMKKVKKNVSLESLIKKRRQINGSKEPKELNDDKSNLFSELDLNVKEVKRLLGNCSDLVVREFLINQVKNLKGIAVYIGGITDEKVVSEFIMQAITNHQPEDMKEQTADSKDVQFTTIEQQILNIAKVNILDNWNNLIYSLLSGNTILFIDGFDKAYSGGTTGGEWRSIEEPSSEIAIRGPKDGFIESIITNIVLIRRRIKSPHLRVEQIQLGTVSQTSVAFLYVDGIVNEKLVNEVRERLNSIQADEILSSANIEEFIQDNSMSPFPTVFITERPDMVANALVEGRITIIVDGTPFVLVVPTSFSQFFKAAEDYYQRFDFSTLIRILRYLSFIIALLGPSIYVALITFHQDIIPTTLVISLAAQREGIPFPAFIEAIIMEVTFEVLREAGIRMPRAIGQAVSIVGALVIGQAAVQAGIVSAAMVIVVAGTGIASFTTPSYNLAVAARILRFLFMILAGLFGLYGILIGLIALVAHLSSLRSFGYPYLAPFAPFISEDQKDGLFRFPIGSKTTRPRLINKNRVERMDKGLKPSPPNGKDR